jgi:hypothetical protein
MFSGIPGKFLGLNRVRFVEGVAIKRLAYFRVRVVTEVTQVVVYSTQIQTNQEVVWEAGISF